MVQRFGSSHKTENIKRSIRRIFFVFIVILSFFLILIGKPDFYLINKASDLFVTVITPVVEFVSYPVNYVKNVVKNTKELSKVYDEKKELEDTLAKIQEKAYKIDYLISENKALKKQLKYQDYGFNDYITAKIIADDGNSFTDSFLITAGKNQNIEIYDPVLAQGSLIGRVVYVSEKYSRVLQITDMSSKIPVMIERNRIRAILEGTDSVNNFPVLVDIQSKEPLIIGDKIITSGISGFFPEGIAIGIIAEIDEETGIKVQPYSTFDTTEFVKVIKFPRIKEIKQIEDKNIIEDDQQ